MFESSIFRAAIGAVAFWFAAATSTLSFAQADQTIDLPAGIACAGFDLRIEISGTVQQNKLFNDKNGNPVRFISVGKGSALTFTNLQSGNSLALRPNGSGSHFHFNADGTLTVNATGHNVIILFPTDFPAGPSTIQYVGRVLYTVSADGTNTFTLRQVSGTRSDICAALG